MHDIAILAMRSKYLTAGGSETHPYTTPTPPMHLKTSWLPFTFALIMLLLLFLPGTHPPIAAQDAPDCGTVDAISYPIPDLTDRGDDFGIYRGKFGGLHTGADIAFYRYGDPVFAIANGRVTYADPAGWDTEKGVVILEHTFPDGSLYYSLYGHMEPIGDYFFPGVGQCVAHGSIVGAVGFPSLSAPHLHFEVRDFGPNDGGPGYWDTNPLEAGWQHPLDFVRRWQVRLHNQGGYRPFLTEVVAVNPPGVPPITTDDGGLITAKANLVEGIGPDSAVQWRMELSDTIAGMVLLPDGRLLLRLADDTILLLRDGRYEGMWFPDVELTGAPLYIGSTVAFFTVDNALRGYTPDGALLWGTPPLGDRIGSYTATADQIAVSTRPRDPETPPAWHLIGADGQIRYQVGPSNPPHAVLTPEGSAYLLDGAMLYHVSADFVPTPLSQLPYTAGRSTSLGTDAAGNAVIFMALDESLLYSYDQTGELLWTTTLPGTHRQPPLLAAGEFCLLYALATDGTLYAIDTASGAIRGQVRLYAGGSNGHPNARLLEVLPNEQVRFGAGYLTVATVDGYALAGIDFATDCTSGP
ncbi:peptidoglycan DD-metalloendopeptidase family protein [Chloroflexota bacterium]